jgi:hypothetical protein
VTGAYEDLTPGREGSHGGLLQPRAHGDERARLDVLVGDSRVMTSLAWILSLPGAAWHGAKVKQVWDSAVPRTDHGRVRSAAVVLATAVVTHVVVFLLLGVGVRTSDWGIRAGLLAGCAVGYWRPRALTAAWNDKKRH